MPLPPRPRLPERRIVEVDTVAAVSDVVAVGQLFGWEPAYAQTLPASPRYRVVLEREGRRLPG